MTTFERAVVNLSALIVSLSGLVYAWMKYFMTPQDPYSVLNHPLQPWVLDLHLLAGPALIFASGLVVREHVMVQLARSNGRQGRHSGLIALACLLPMIATGYLIQMLADETARRACVAIHLVTGGLFFIAFVLHLIMSRRMAARRRAAGTQPPAPSLSWLRLGVGPSAGLERGAGRSPR